MHLNQMSHLTKGCARGGNLRADLLESWGLSEHIAIAGGAGDSAATACGMVLLDVEQGFVSLGTSGVILASNDVYNPKVAPAVHTFCHAVPNRCYQMSVMLSVTDGLSWLSRIAGCNPATVTFSVDEYLKAPSQILFLPYPSRERTPHNDAINRGVFISLGIESGISDLTQVVVEGVGFRLRDGAQAQRSTGTTSENLFVVDGGSRSKYWLKLLATVLDTPPILPGSAKYSAALGAAKLSLLLVTKKEVSKVIMPPARVEVIEPDLTKIYQYHKAYQPLQEMYQNKRNIQ